MKNKENATPGYMWTQGMFWMTYCVIGGFTSSYLIGKGYSNTMVGIVHAVSAILSAFLQVFLADFADHSRKISAKHIMLGLTAVFLLSCIGITFTEDHLSMLHITYCISKTLLYMMMPFLSTMGIESINQGKRLNYGLSRGTGSFTYAIMISVLGRVIETKGVDLIPRVAFVSGILLLLATLHFKFDKIQIYSTSGKSSDRVNSHQISLAQFFSKYPRYGIFLLGSILLYYGYSLINNFGYQVAMSKGGGNAEMGVAMAISALSEIPIMAAFDKLLEHKSSRFWLLFSGIFVELKVALTWLVPGITGYYAVATLQMLGYAVFIVGSVYYVNEIIEPEDRIKGQAFIALVTTASGIISSMIGGIMMDSIGVPVTLFVTIFVSASGLLVMFLSA